MKYRVRLDMSFDSETDARTLLEFSKNLTGKAVNTVASASDEKSFFSLEICRHDENLPCILLEKIEIGTTGANEGSV